jgi:hypothetical protein
MKLSDFYRQTVDLNDSGQGGWSSIYYGVLSRVINENGYKNVAEVGIGYGTHAKQLLKETSVSNLILVDPMVYYPNDGFAEDVMKQTPEIPGNNFEEFAGLIRKELSPWEGRYTWLRVPSLAVTQEQIPDGSLDCIFIDGDHSYDAVLADLSFWWKKLRVGGQLLGDDYWMPTVSSAVEHFAKRNLLRYDFLYRHGSTYKIYRFKKD